MPVEVRLRIVVSAVSGDGSAIIGLSLKSTIKTNSGQGWESERKSE